MKQKLFILASSSCLISFGQIEINVVEVRTNDLVYDSNSNKIYVSIPSTNGNNGNSLGKINPDTYQLEGSVFIGSEPTILAISDNGQYIYAGFSGSSSVRRYNVSDDTADIQFSLGSHPNFGPYFAEDIEVMPGSPNTIAVSRKNPNISPAHAGVAIFDDNVMRPNTTPSHTGSNKIKFINSDSLVGHNNATTEFGLRRLIVDANGVSNISVHSGILNTASLDFTYHSSSAYFTNGMVIDMLDDPYLIGQFPDVFGPVIFDIQNNMVCFASFTWGGDISFRRYNPNTFLLIDSIHISQVFGTVKSLITCGNGCYAFNTNDKVVIIKESALSLTENEHNKIDIYPNPTTEYIYINSNVEISKVELYDINGRIINSVERNINNLYLKELIAGVYVLKIFEKNGIISTHKIIKK
jgi:hypothetical protein